MVSILVVWFEFIIVVEPATLMVLISTIFFPLGAMLRPEWIIPAYTGGIFGIYSLWKIFLYIKFDFKCSKTRTTLYYVLGVIGLIILFLGGKPTGIHVIEFLYGPWI